MFREGFVLSTAKESKESSVASLVALQESGYDENVLEATIPRKLQPVSVEGVARTIIDTSGSY